MTTPPGWYPDPGDPVGHASRERWWNGSAWTEHTRAAAPPSVPPSVPSPLPQPPPAVQQPKVHGTEGMPPHPPLPPTPPPGYRAPVTGAGTHRLPVPALIAGLLALAVLAAGVLLLVGLGDVDDPRAAGAQPSAPADGERSGNGSGPPAVPDEGRTPPGEAGEAVDPVLGVRLPLFDGWQDLSARTPGITLVTAPYPCPGGGAVGCFRAGATVRSASGFAATDAEGIAREDIERHAEAAYDEQAYGGISGTEQELAEPVTVAGQRGYRVRWRIDNELGPDGRVESVVFSSPRGTGGFLLLRLSVDATDRAPDPGVMDTLVRAVTAVTTDPPRKPNEI